MSDMSDMDFRRLELCFGACIEFGMGPVHFHSESHLRMSVLTDSERLW